MNIFPVWKMVGFLLRRWLLGISEFCQFQICLVQENHVKLLWQLPELSQKLAILHPQFTRLMFHRERVSQNLNVIRKEKKGECLIVLANCSFLEMSLFHSDSILISKWKDFYPIISMLSFFRKMIRVEWRRTYKVIVSMSDQVQGCPFAWTKAEWKDNTRLVWLSYYQNKLLREIVWHSKKEFQL